MIKKITGFFLFICLISSLGFSKTKISRLDEESKNFYNYARYLFTKNERKIFLSLPDKNSRKDFIKVFWEIRDPDPNTTDNEFKLEIEERYEFAKRYLKEGVIPGWKTDRGRIYILLGAPHSKDERYYTYGDTRKPVKLWYYQGSNIFVLFIDKKGFGRYEMDLRNTSLSLVDELKKRKYYITAKEGSGFETSEIKFKFRYDANTRELIYNINSEKIYFEQTSSTEPLDSKEPSTLKMKAKFKIDILIYANNKNIRKKTEVKVVLIDKAQLLKKDTKIQIRIPVNLPAGKVLIDTIVTDLSGEAVGRKHLKIKVNENAK